MMNLFEQQETESFKRFQKYHEENPQIYEFFKRYTLRSIERGYKHLSAEFIFNVIRWETPIGASGDDFKINNDFKPWYSRLFMKEFPQFQDFFRKRKSKADEAFAA